MRRVLAIVIALAAGCHGLRARGSDHEAAFVPVTKLAHAGTGGGDGGKDDGTTPPSAAKRSRLPRTRIIHAY
jgi:hypothetical protein